MSTARDLTTTDERRGRAPEGRTGFPEGEKRAELKGLQKENGRLGTLVFLAVEAMFFAGLLAAGIVLSAGGENVPVQGTDWIRLGVAGVAVFTLELARRHADGGLRLTAGWGINLAILAGAVWLAISSDSILGAGGGSPAALAGVSPTEGCRLILHTLLAFHILVATLFAAQGSLRLLRGSPEAATPPARAELMWILALAVQLGSGMVG